MVSKMFGKIKNRPTKAEFEDELLDSDFNNFTKALTGGGDDPESARQQELAARLAEHQKLCYTPAQLEDVMKKMKKSDDVTHTLFEIPESIRSQWARKKMTLYYINLPAMIGIPLFIEFADLEAMYAERAETVMALLSAVDMIFFVKSYMVYTFL